MNCVSQDVVPVHIAKRRASENVLKRPHPLWPLLSTFRPGATSGSRSTGRTCAPPSIVGPGEWSRRLAVRLSGCLQRRWELSFGTVSATTCRTAASPEETCSVYSVVPPESPWRRTIDCRFAAVSLQVSETCSLPLSTLLGQIHGTGDLILGRDPPAVCLPLGVTRTDVACDTSPAN